MKYIKTCVLVVVSSFCFASSAAQDKTSADIFSKQEMSALKGLGYGTLGVLNLASAGFIGFTKTNDSLTTDALITALLGSGFWMAYKSICALKEAQESAGENKRTVKALIFRMAKLGMLSAFGATYCFLLYEFLRTKTGIIGDKGLALAADRVYLFSNLAIYAYELFKTGKEIRAHDKENLITFYKEKIEKLF